MPELPEVETVRRVLLTQIVGKTISDIKVNYAHLLTGCDEATFVETLTGQTINDIWRYGKYLLLVMTKTILVVHLRMEGKFYIYHEDLHQASKHEHLVITLDKQIQMVYHDTRKFGRMEIYPRIDDFINFFKTLKKLGPEANEEIEPHAFYQTLLKSPLPIKIALLDQHLLCGLGNIYVNETLFKAHISPFKKACHLTYQEVVLLLEAAKTTLEQAIICGGTTIRSYTSSLGVTGRFAINLLVHGRQNLPCKVCQTAIVKCQLGGRGTYFCPVCQNKMDIKLVGVTGNIGSGKSTLLKELSIENTVMFSCDDIVSELYQDATIVEKLFDALDIIKTGQAFQNPKRMVLDKIEENDENFKKLQTVLRPYILGKLNELVKQASLISANKRIIVEVPLLFEYQLITYFDLIVVVLADLKTIEERLEKHREMPKALIKKMLLRQYPHYQRRLKNDKIHYLENVESPSTVVASLKQIIINNTV